MAPPIPHEPNAIDADEQPPDTVKSPMPINLDNLDRYKSGQYTRGEVHEPVEEAWQLPPGVQLVGIDRALGPLIITYEERRHNPNDWLCVTCSKPVDTCTCKDPK
jgi:hypothetical protein